VQFAKSAVPDPNGGQFGEQPASLSLTAVPSSLLGFQVAGCSCLLKGRLQGLSATHGCCATCSSAAPSAACAAGTSLGLKGPGQTGAGEWRWSPGCRAEVHHSSFLALQGHGWKEWQLTSGLLRTEVLSWYRSGKQVGCACRKLEKCLPYCLRTRLKFFSF